MLYCMHEWRYSSLNLCDTWFSAGFLTELDDASVAYPKHLSRVCQFRGQTVKSNESDQIMSFGYTESHCANLQGRAESSVFMHLGASASAQHCVSKRACVYD